jgi:hypothetical protein
MRGRYEYNPYRFRAAVAALPFTAPKLAASYNVNGNVKDFAELLTRLRLRPTRCIVVAGTGIELTGLSGPG